jgi:hypothetical protein
MSFSREQLAAQLGQHQVAVGGDGWREPARIEILHLGFELPGGGDLLLDFGARTAGHEGIVLVEAGLRGGRRIVTEDQLVENAVGEFVELAVADLCEAGGS